jgi:hypothetical protein
LLDVNAAFTNRNVAQNKTCASKQSGELLSFQERAMAAVVAQRHDAHKLRTYEFEIGYKQAQVANLLRQQELHLQFIALTGKGKRNAFDPDFASFHNYSKEVEKINEELNELHEKHANQCSQDPIVAKLLTSIKVQLSPPFDELIFLQEQVRSLNERQSAHAKLMESRQEHMYVREEFFTDLDVLLGMVDRIQEFNDKIEELQDEGSHKRDCDDDANDLDKKPPAKKLKGAERKKYLRDPIGAPVFDRRVTDTGDT